MVTDAHVLLSNANVFALRQSLLFQEDARVGILFLDTALSHQGDSIQRLLV